MKIIRSIVSVFAFALMYTQGMAQASLIKINKDVVTVQYLNKTDAVDASGKLQYSASFDLQLNNSVEMKNIVTALQLATVSKSQLSLRTSGSVSTAALELSLIDANANYAIVEEKLYTGITIEEIKISGFNAADKSVVVLSCKIKASKATILPTAGSKILGESLKSTKALASYFKVQMGNLPCSRIFNVSSLMIKPQASGLIGFTIELAAVDGQPWNQWLSTGAAGRTKEQGQITLLSPNFRDVFFTIKLVDVQINSYSSSSGNGNTIPKATVGLAAAAVSLQ